MGSGALAERQIDLAARACTVSCARRQPDPMDSIKLKGEENISRTIHENEIARAWKSTPTFDRSFARYPRGKKERNCCFEDTDMERETISINYPVLSVSTYRDKSVYDGLCIRL